MEPAVKSIVTEYTEISAFSQNPKECEHHLIFGTGLRKLADEDGIWIPLTHNEHNTGELKTRIHDNPAAEKLSKIAGQLAYEKNYYREMLEHAGELEEDEDPARDIFRRRYGMSYL